MDYVELVCRSNFSFLEGASHPEDLVARAHALGYQALALTDEASVSGSVRAHLAAESLGLPLIHGAQFLIAPTSLPAPADGQAHDTLPDPAQPAPNGSIRLVALVKNREGWRQLCRIITLGRRRADKGHYQLLKEDFQAQPMADCLMLWMPNPQAAEPDLFQQGQWVRNQFGDRAHLAYSLHLRGDDKAWLRQLTALGALLRLPLVAVGDVRMHRRSDKPLADLLTAIRLGRPIADCGRQLSANAEQSLRPRLKLARLYPEAHLAASLAIARQCQFSLQELRYEYPDEIVPPGLSPAQWLRHLTEEGVRRRYPGSLYPQGLPASVRQQIEHELALIHDLHYEAYFLTVYDIVAFARSRGILCQGRGSAANSAVCYCLGITEVDPARMSMLFERFISKERNEPPDIDVDFEHQRREEVIQYIYGKYGRDRAALAAALIRYRPRSALRDTGKALGLHGLLIDLAARGRSWWDGRQITADGLGESIQEGLARLAALPQAEPLPPPPAPGLLERWADLANRLMGFPRHLSQHVGGFVIARHSLADLVPVENAAMAERSVIQWDKDDIDALGLLKVDVLALGMLSAIRRALEFMGQKAQGLSGGPPSPHGHAAHGHPPHGHAAPPILIQDIPAEDAATYEMISAADTVGVFQIESRAQMSMLPRLRPQCFYDLVIEVAIVRPGPIQGGMVHPYLRRRQGLEPIDYPGPAVRQALERTLGVPIFQEQVMQLAILAAGFTPGEADQLRRAMAAWRKRGTLGPFHDKVVNGMLARGYSQDFAERVFSQIEGFGEYGFPESHAASFALLVYVSCYIKRHHPDAFLAALLNSQPMGFYAPAQLVRDAQAHGVEVRPVDVQLSGRTSCLELPDGREIPGDARAPKLSQLGKPAPPTSRLWPVRLGLDRIAQLSTEAMHRILTTRQTHGPFQSVDDLARRAQLSRTDLEALARANALTGLTRHRHEAHWLATGHERLTAILKDSAIDEVPLQAHCLAPPTEADGLLADYASLGLSLGRHPVAFIRDQLQAQFKSLPAAVLKQMPNGRLARATGLVTHRQRPSTAKGVLFITLEDETGSLNLIVQLAVLERHRQAAMHGQLLTAYGRWQRDEHIAVDAPGQVQNLLALRLEDHTPLLAQALGRVVERKSRDFH